MSRGGRPDAARTARARPRQRGLTLIEAMLACAVLTVVGLGVLVVLTTTLRSTREIALRETARAVATARAEALAVLAPAEVAALWTEQGTSFAVTGLQPPTGVAAVGLTTILDEAEASRALSVAVDLDDDGIFAEEETPHAGYVTAVVRVVLRWTTTGEDANQTQAVAVVVARSE